MLWRQNQTITQTASNKSSGSVWQIIEELPTCKWVHTQGTNPAAGVYRHACLVDGTFPGLGLCFLVVTRSCRLLYFLIWTPAAHRSVTSRPVSDICHFVIISISDLFTLWLQNRKKPKDLCVLSFGEEETATLQTPCLKAEEFSKLQITD